MELRETISFNAGKLLRKRIGSDYRLVPVEELTKGNEIVYVKANKKESIDNYILKIYTDDKYASIELIFEPFICLKSFCTVLQRMKGYEHFDASNMSKLYWIPENKKDVISRVIRSLLQKDVRIDQQYYIEMKADSIWADFITPLELAIIFKEKPGRITYEKLYNIANKAGLTLKFSTFKEYCTMDIKEENNKHYFFIEDTNLLAIGRLVGNQNIIENYKTLNEQGREVAKLLQVIGRSISRVASGRAHHFSEIDSLIEGNLQKCKVSKIMVEPRSR